MTNVFMIHGLAGSPQENWFPWTINEFEKLGCKVTAPAFPTPHGHNLENWLKVFDQHRKEINGGTILIGHSMGATFILTLLEKLQTPVKAAVLVAGFTGPLGFGKIDELNKTFAEKDFDWQKIRKTCGKFFVFHSDNDPYIPLANAENIAAHLGTKVMLVKNAGHFNAKAGYDKFDELLKALKPIL